MSRASICPVHRKTLTFVKAENYTYWQCPEGCWLNIDPPLWGDRKVSNTEQN